MLRSQIIFLFCFLFFSQAQAGFFSDLGKTFTDGFDKDGLIILAVGAGATAIAFSQDQAIHDTWVSHQRMNQDVSKIGDFWGSGIPEAAIAGGQIIWDYDNGIAHTNALVASTTTTFALKYATARPRPDSDTRTSFPSGHTQAAFATATSLTMSYGLKAAFPLYTMAFFTGLSRFADNAHWLSDVVAGAAIGTFFGRASYKTKMMVAPMKVDRGYGLQLTYRF